MKKGLIAFLLVGGFAVSAQSTDGLTEVFNDDFSNNRSAWLIEETGKGTSWINYNEKRLVFDGNVGGNGRVTMSAPKGFNGDFVLKATIWCKECAKDGNAFFGLMFGYDVFGTKDDSGLYQIRLSQQDGDGVWIKANNSNGSILFEKMVDASFDPEDPNEIAVERKGETVKYYLNGSEIYSNVSSETSGNKISFISGGKVKVFMSNISMYAN